MIGSGLAFELRGRNQNSDKYNLPRIEFCVDCIFRIFEYSVFEILIAILDIVFGPARARGSQLGSRRAARRDRVRARYAESRVCRPWFWRCPSACLAPPRIAGGAFCGHQDHLGQVQSPWRSREAIKKYLVWNMLSRTVGMPIIPVLNLHVIRSKWLHVFKKM